MSFSITPYQARENWLAQCLPFKKPEIKLINDYLGDADDATHAEELAKHNVSKVVTKNFASARKLAEKELGTQELQFFDEVVQNIMGALVPFDYSFAAPIEPFKAQFVALNLYKKSILPENGIRKIFRDEDKKSCPFLSDAILENLISEPSRKKLKPILEDILDCQLLFKKYAPPLVVTSGDSKGFQMKIQWKGVTYGYLVGTLHYLFTSEMQKAAACTPKVQKKLHQCSIIGTEIRVNSSYDSVDGTLVEFAKPHGIVNFGIDVENRDDLEQDLEKESLPEMSKALEMIEAYRKGDADTVKTWVKEDRKLKPQKNLRINSLREDAIAANIDLFLNTFEKIAQERKIKVPKSFFAIGTAHLLGENAVPHRLEKMGWSVTLI